MRARFPRRIQRVPAFSRARRIDDFSALPYCDSPGSPHSPRCESRRPSPYRRLLFLRPSAAVAGQLTFRGFCRLRSADCARSVGFRRVQDRLTRFQAARLVAQAGLSRQSARTCAIRARARGEFDRDAHRARTKHAHCSFHGTATTARASAQKQQRSAESI